jgi:hypothetical protein
MHRRKKTPAYNQYRQYSLQCSARYSLDNPTFKSFLPALLCVVSLDLKSFNLKLGIGLAMTMANETKGCALFVALKIAVWNGTVVST